MKRSFVLLFAFSLLLGVAASLSAEEGTALPAPVQAEPQAVAAPDTPSGPADLPSLTEFLHGLQGAQWKSNCPTPMECIEICYAQGCFTTDGCDGMGGCLCSNCS